MNCHKKVYESKSKAKSELKKLRKKNRTEKNVYLCQDCDMWHLTSYTMKDVIKLKNKNMENKIFFANLTIQYQISAKKWELPHKINRMVVSGTDEQIKGDDILKRKILLKSKTRAVANKFDLNRIRIIEIEKIKELGLGYMATKK